MYISAVYHMNIACELFLITLVLSFLTLTVDALCVSISPSHHMNDLVLAYAQLRSYSFVSLVSFSAFFFSNFSYCCYRVVDVVVKRDSNHCTSQNRSSIFVGAAAAAAATATVNGCGWRWERNERKKVQSSENLKLFQKGKPWKCVKEWAIDNAMLKCVYLQLCAHTHTNLCMHMYTNV